MKILVFVFLFAVNGITSIFPQYSVESPDGNIKMSFRLNSDLEPQYSITYRSLNFLKWSNLGLNFKGSGQLNSGFNIIGVENNSIDETFRIYSGKSAYSRNYCNEIKVSLEEKNSPNRKLDIYLRAYNDGAALRYGFPEQNNMNQFIISTEDTYFNFGGNYECWAMKKDRFRHSYEGEYREYRLSNIDNKPGDSTSFFPYITLPLTMKMSEDLYVCVSEANITNYPGMHLVKTTGNTLRSKLAPDTVYKDISVRGNTPSFSPWRLFIIGEKAGDLIESNLIMNLNDPNKIPDAESWIKPGKSTWSWWAEDRGFSPDFGYQILGTKTVKYYIDFAAANNFQYVTLDGGWYGWFDATKDDAVHDITKSLPELDLPEVTRYAASKGIGIILWVVWYELERQMTEAMDYYRSLGIKGIKVDFMDRDDQYMTDFYKRTAEECAARKMIVTFHGAYKPDGLSRTYPNILTYEGVLGNENARWITGFPHPKHNVTLAFTRMVAGPMDYTPGSFTNVPEEKFQGRWRHPMTKGTRSQQLAMPIVYETGIQSLCESPKIYEQFPEFEVYRQLPGTWDSTLVIDGKIGEYIIIARKSEDKWFIGGMTNSQSRDVKFSLNFLGNSRYDAIIYSDASDGDVNPEKVITTKINTGPGNKFAIKMAKGGGFAVILTKSR